MSSRRRILIPTVCLLLSAGIFTLVIACWIRSEFVYSLISAERVWQQDGAAYQHRMSLISNSGRLWFDWGRQTQPNDSKWPIPSDRDARWRLKRLSAHAHKGVFDGVFRTDRLGPTAHALGFAYYADRAAEPDTVIDNFGFILPFWLLTAITAIPIATFARSVITRRRHNRNLSAQLCPTCSYDLRAHQPKTELRTQNSELPPRCPECGTHITHAHL